MSKHNVVELTSREAIDPLNELLQTGARQSRRDTQFFEVQRIGRAISKRTPIMEEWEKAHDIPIINQRGCLARTGG